MILEILSLICLLAILGMSIFLVVTYITMKESIVKLEEKLPKVTAIQSNMAKLSGEVPASPVVAKADTKADTKQQTNAAPAAKPEEKKK